MKPNLTQAPASSGKILQSALFGSCRRWLLLLSAVFLATVSAFAQGTVRGIVTDAANDPLAGVTVIVKGKDAVGGVTDVNGRYEVKAPSGATLEFSFLGYQSLVFANNNKTQLDVTMKDDNQVLEDVVVVGYGTQKKVNLTGAVAQVTSEVLENRSTNSVTQMLQGAMPNVNIQVNTGAPGAGGTISIRGVGSLNSSSPLILVDGIPGSIDQLNANDVESISVLKDASSAAIYGARAAFGVILVTTRKAKTGSAKVTYNGYWSWSKPTTRTDFVNSGYEWATIQDRSYIARYGAMGQNTFYDEADYAELEARRYDTTENPERPWVVVGDDGKYRYYGNFDWWDWLYKKNMASQSHSVSISGGNEKLQYYVSGSFYTKEGLIKRVDETYDQYTLTAKINAEVKPWLKISNMTSYFDKQHTYPGENASDAAFSRTMLNLAPMYVPVNPDGTWMGKTKGASGWGRGSWLAEGRLANIYQGISQGSVGERRMRNTFALEVVPVKGLSLNADYTFGFTMDDNWRHQGPVMLSSGIPNGDLLPLDNSMGKEDYVSKTMSFNPQHVFNAYANYSKSFNSGHSFAVTAGVNYEKQSYNDLMGYRSHVLSERLHDLNLGTGGTSVGDDGKIVGTLKAEGGASAYELFGFFFRANYNYKERYLLEINGRYDGSSRFLKNNRFGFFPSVSAAWRVSEEPFLKKLNLFDNLKVRASYGVLGNQLGVAMYPFSTIEQQRMSGEYIINGNIPYKLTSPIPVAGDYTWEKVATFNVGLDISVLNNRLNFSGDYFQRNTTDMFVDGVTLPDVYGANPPRQNAGEMKTTGFEVSLSWRDNFKVAGRRFNYSVFGSLGDATSEITKYQGNDAGVITDYYVGKKIGEIWGYRIDGLFQSDAEALEYWNRYNTTAVYKDIRQGTGAWSVARGGDMKFIDQNGDDSIDDGDRTLANHGDLQVIGNSTPRYNYGFGANLEFVGIDFSITFQGIGKCDIYPGRDMDKFWGSWARRGTGFQAKGLAEQAWSEDNKGGYFPQLERGGSAYNGDDAGNIYNGGAQMRISNDRYLQSAAYLRLKNLSLGYTIPAKLTRKIRIDRLRIYFSADNLCYWSPFKSDYVDPELAIASETGRIYPFSETITFGVNLTF